MTSALYGILNRWNQLFDERGMPQDELHRLAHFLGKSNPGETEAILRVIDERLAAAVSDDTAGMLDGIAKYTPIDDIAKESDRQTIVASFKAAISSLDKMIDKLRSLADLKEQVSIFDFPKDVAILLLTYGVGTGFLAFVVHSYFTIPAFISNWMIWAGLIIGAFSWLVYCSSRRKTLYHAGFIFLIEDVAIKTLGDIRQVAQSYLNNVESPHYIDLIHLREAGQIQKKTAIETAQQVGEVTKSVATETAEITKNLIQEGQMLKAEHAASQVQLVDQLAGNLERPAPQASPATPAAVDDRDARIATLQAEIAKLEEIKTLEARLATLKEG